MIIRTKIKLENSVKNHLIKPNRLTLIIYTLIVACTVTKLSILLREEKFINSEEDLKYLAENRNLDSYLKIIGSPLIEARDVVCEDIDNPTIVMVSSEVINHDQRNLIRQTYARKLPTYFFVAFNGNNDDLIQLYSESRKYSDMIVYEMLDSLEPLKTAVMMKWLLKRCSNAPSVLRTDDEVMINPWQLRRLELDDDDQSLIGTKLINTNPERNPNRKRFIPIWLLKDEIIPEYLSRSYVIKGKYIQQLYKAALSVPLINTDDIFYTYLVAKKQLNMTLFHDKKFQLSAPKFGTACTYWNVSVIYDISQWIAVWDKIDKLGKKYDGGYEVCSIFFNWIY